MKEERILILLNQVDEKYIKEAAPLNESNKKKNWLKWGSMAACLAVVMVTAFSFLPNYLNQQGTIPSDDPNGIISNHPNSHTPSTTWTRISMSNIIINQVDDFTSADYVRYNPETDDEVVWSKKDIVAYYGSDLTPAYIPNGLVASAYNSNSAVYIRQDGTVTEDTIQLGFYQSEDMTVKQGFSITASKIGIIQTCLYLLPEDEVKTSNIERTEVTFGYRSMPYSPYHSETHEPSGYYDMYVAEFEKDGIEFQIIAQQMEAKELVKVVTSIIRGDANIIIT